MFIPKWIASIFTKSSEDRVQKLDAHIQKANRIVERMQAASSYNPIGFFDSVRLQSLKNKIFSNELSEMTAMQKNQIRDIFSQAGKSISLTTDEQKSIGKSIGNLAELRAAGLLEKIDTTLQESCKSPLEQFFKKIQAKYPLNLENGISKYKSNLLEERKIWVLLSKDVKETTEVKWNTIIENLNSLKEENLTFEGIKESLKILGVLPQGESPAPKTPKEMLAEHFVHINKPKQDLTFFDKVSPGEQKAVYDFLKDYVLARWVNLVSKNGEAFWNKMKDRLENQTNVTLETVQTEVLEVLEGEFINLGFTLEDSSSPSVSERSSKLIECIKKKIPEREETPSSGRLESDSSTEKTTKGFSTLTKERLESSNTAEAQENIGNAIDALRDIAPDNAIDALGDIAPDNDIDALRDIAPDNDIDALRDIAPDNAIDALRDIAPDNSIKYLSETPKTKIENFLDKIYSSMGEPDKSNIRGLFQDHLIAALDNCGDFQDSMWDAIEKQIEIHISARSPNKLTQNDVEISLITVLGNFFINPTEKGGLGLGLDVLGSASLLFFEPQNRLKVLV